MSDKLENIKNSIADYKAGRYKIYEVSKVDTKSLRKNLQMNQEEFAREYRIPVKTLRHWEQNDREPNSTARAYLKVIAERPDIVREVLNNSA